MADEMVIKTGEGKLVDEIYSSPVDQWQHSVRRWVILIASGDRRDHRDLITEVLHLGSSTRVLRHSGAFQVRLHRQRAGRHVSSPRWAACFRPT